MCKSFLASVIFSFILTNVSLSQDSHSIQLNWGIIMPMSSSKGLTTSIQFNYSINPQFELYGYLGYSNWDLYKVTFHEELSDVQKQQYFTTYPETDHVLVPIYIGSKINIHTNKLFTSFVNVELGYSYLSYDNYDVIKIINPETNAVINYQTNSTTVEKKRENLFGFGLGAGILHPMTKRLNLILSYKLNTYINSNYFGLFSTRGTYSTFSAGFNFSI
jgi:hypothetical protein